MQDTRVYSIKKAYDVPLATGSLECLPGLSESEALKMSCNKKTNSLIAPRTVCWHGNKQADHVNLMLQFYRYSLMGLVFVKVQNTETICLVEI